MSITAKKPASPLYDIVAAVMLAIFAFALYANTIGHDYNMDDELVTIDQELTTQGISAIPEIFSSYYYDNHIGNQYEYRPVVLSSFAIEHAFFDPDPQVSHTINVLLYMLTAVALFFTLRRVWAGYNPLLPLVTTILFIAHPLHTEAVASIKNRDEILCFIGGILALNYAHRFVNSKKWHHYALFIFFFVFGILSKRSVLSYGILIPVAIVWFTRVSRPALFLISFPLGLATFYFSPTSDKIINLLIAAGFVGVPFLLQFLFFNELPLFAAVKQTAAQLKQSYMGTDITIVTEQAKPATKEKKITVRQPFDVFSITVYTVIMGLALYLGANHQKWLTLIFSSGLVLISLLASQRLRMPFALLTLAWFQVVSLLLDLPDLSMVVFSAAIFLIVYFKDPPFIFSMALASFAALGYFVFFLKIDPLFSLAAPIVLALLYRHPKLRIVVYLALVAAIVAPVVVNPRLAATILVPIVAGINLYMAGRANVKKYFMPALLVALPVITAIWLITWHPMQGSPLHEYLSPAPLPKTAILPPPDVDPNALNVVPQAGRELNIVENPLVTEHRLAYRTATPFAVIAEYARLLVYPVDLRFYYGMDTVSLANWAHPVAGVTFVVFILLLIISLLFARRWPVLTFGIFYLLLSLLFISNLGVLVAGMVAERLLYVGSLGFTIICAWLILQAFKALDKSPVWKLSIPVAVVVVVVAGLYTYRVVTRNMVWKDRLTLYSHDTQGTRSAKALQLMGYEYMQRSVKDPANAAYNQEMARSYFLKSLTIYPRFHSALYNLGYLYAIKQDCQGAMPFLRRSLNEEPFVPDALFHYANCLDQSGQLDSAIFYYKRVLTQQPDFVPYYTNLSYIYYRQGKYQESIEVNKTAMQRAPNSFEPYVNLGKTYLQLGDMQNAIVYFEKGHERNPQMKDLWSILAELHRRTGNPTRAKYFEDLLQSQAGRQ